MLHSSIVGGSTASRVINCPGSVALVAKMPPRASSEYADRGTLLHDAISLILDEKETTPIIVVRGIGFAVTYGNVFKFWKNSKAVFRNLSISITFIGFG